MPVGPGTPVRIACSPPGPISLSGQFDLLILDLGLPGMDGLQVLEELRFRDRHLPVIILTARDSLPDTVTGLDGGADDYVTKPFRFEELLARVRARLRDRAKEETILRVGNASLDLRTRRARVEDRTIDLTAREFTMAEVLFRHPGPSSHQGATTQPCMGL
jgi:DNA-binding response OmpR family regulator